jgi:dimethylamine/trimethylamine dehydrogenase
MMTENSSLATEKYLTTLLRYYEEEISGEPYFHALLIHFDEVEKITLLAKIERKAAETVKPLLQKYDLAPRPEQSLCQIGKRHVKRHAEMQ